MSAETPIEEGPTPRGSLSWMARNPVAANLLMILLIVGGLVYATQIQQEVFPEFTTDRVSIAVVYPGASPAEVETGIVLSIEDAVRGLDAVKEVTSVASEGSASVSIELLASADKSKALQDVKNAVDRISSFPELAERPIVNLAEARREVLTLIVYGDLEERVMRQLAERAREDLLNNDGITLVELGAARNLEVTVEIPEERLRSLGLTLNDVARLIERTALELPAGAVRTEAGEILLRTQERRDFASEYGDIPVATSADGTLITLGSIAEVRESFEDTDQESFFNGKPAQRVQVFRIGDESPQSVSKVVYDYIDRVAPDLPEGVGFAVWNDQSEIYRDRVTLLIKNAFLGLMLVLITLGLFVEPKLAFWVTLGIPISILGAFVFIPLFGASLNMISLFAFIVTLGIVVDDAVVVGESIYEKRERGISLGRAAIEGVREIAGPVIFAVLTNIVAFMPLFFVPGGIGNAFRQIPSITVAVFIVSLIESLFILPAHLAHRGKDTPFWRILGIPNRTFDRGLKYTIEKIYAPALALVLRWRYTMIAGSIATLFLAVGAVGGGYVAVGFMPRIDSDIVTVSANLPFGVPVEETRRLQDRLLTSLDQALEENGGERIMRGVYTQIGEALRGGGPPTAGAIGGGGSHVLGIQVALVPSGEREVGGVEFANAWRAITGEIGGLENISFNAQIAVGGGAAIDVALSHESIDVLEAAAAELGETLSDFDGVSDIDDGFSAGKPQISFRLRPEARSLGMTVADLAAQVRASFFGAEALRLQRGRNEVKVLVRLPDQERRTLSTVENLMLRTPAGGEIPLFEAATVEYGSSYTEIRRTDGRRTINVTADVDPQLANANSIVAALRSEHLPALEQKHSGLRSGFEGEQQTQNESLGALGIGMALALIGVFALLAIAFQSYVQPLIIMAIIPFGAVGGIAAHYALDFNLNLISFFGLIALSGIVINDSLVLVVTMNRYRAQGIPLQEAVSLACQRRFRPILLTTMTTVLGLLPMILETSVQARFLIPMALSIAGGELFSTVILLGLVPSIYLVVEDVIGGLKRLYRWLEGEEPPEVAMSAPVKETGEAALLLAESAPSPESIERGSNDRAEG